MKQIFSTENAPVAIGPYSQAVEAGGFVFISGQIPVDPSTGSLSGETIEKQARQSLSNLKAVLDAAGLGMESVVKTTVYLSDMNHFSKMNEIYSEFFTGDYPARVAVEVSRLPKDVLVEIEAIAVR